MEGSVHPGCEWSFLHLVGHHWLFVSHPWSSGIFSFSLASSLASGFPFLDLSINWTILPFGFWFSPLLCSYGIWNKQRDQIIRFTLLCFTFLHFKLMIMCCHSEIKIDTGKWLNELWRTVFVEVLDLIIALIFVQGIQTWRQIQVRQRFLISFILIVLVACNCAAKLSLDLLLPS